jgi:threonine dehydratase/DNA-binding Lrp family transcriptional regulator
MKNLELSLNQKKVLNFLEENSNATTGDISEKLNIVRPTAKQTLQRLLDLGLIYRHGLGRGAYYALKREDEILDSKGDKLVVVYKGNDAFRVMFKEIENELKKGDFYWTFAFKDEYYDKELVSLLHDFHRTLGKKGIDDRLIAMLGVRDVIKQSYKDIPTFKMRFTDMNVPIGMIILKDKVINLMWGKFPIAIMIKSSVICKQYQDFFLSNWNAVLIHELQQAEKMVKPGNTPIIVPRETIYGVCNLLIKDESQNPTHTFKDRLAYEMIRPMLEEVRQGKMPKPMTFGSISYGNTAKAMGHYVSLLNEMAGKKIARALAFVPPALSKKTFGPDTEGNTVKAKDILVDISKTCDIVPIDLSKKIYRPKDLEELAREHKKVTGEFVDITEGLNRPAYVNIIIEAIEQQLRFSPDYVIVPFGAGILCNEVIDYVAEHKLKTKVIPVSSGDPDTIAVMLYGPIWVDTAALLKEGKAFTRHEPIDRKGRNRKPYVVYHVSDEAILDAMKELKKNNISAEPSGASGIALLKHLKKIDPAFQSKKHTVLVINTGNGIGNYV